jgi:hypothetical protein
MARLTIDCGTISYDYPDGFDIQSETTATDVESINIAGRMGRFVRSFGNPIGQKTIVLFGRLYGTSASDLNDKTADLMRVHTFGAAMSLTDNTLGRHAEVWFAGIRYTDRKHAHIREITIRLIAPRGVWGRGDAFLPSKTTASINSTKLVRYGHVDYAGSVPGPAQLILTPSSSTWPVSGDGEVTWRGRNLVTNSSFEDGVGARPDDWDTTGGGNDPDVIEWFGRSGSRCIQISKPGGTNHSLSRDIPCDAGTTYTYSAYAALTGAGAANLTLLIQSRDAADGFLTNSSTNFSVPFEHWTRFSVTHTTHASAVVVRLIFRCQNTGEELYVDDVQLERSGVSGEFVNTSLPRYKHVTFALQSPAQLTQATGDALSIDMVRARTRLFRSGSWQENNDEVNGHYFELVPGLNHIEFTPPTAGNLDVEIRHRALFL